MKKLYLAYGSNLSMYQMSQRCPNAVPLATATLKDYRLLFKGSKTGSYLTVEPYDGGQVPLVVWSISEVDERNLDYYEGCPDFYYKKEIEVELRSLVNGTSLGTAPALIYIMHESRPLGCPSIHYVNVCLEGYRRFGFDSKIMLQALNDSIGKRQAKKICPSL